MTAAAPGRVRGVDVARAIALLAMMSVHLLPEFGDDGRVRPAFVLASGRASALFAVLAGVGLALVTGGEQPRLRPRRALAAAVTARALLTGALGMLLVLLEPPVAVILTNYAALFVVALPFLGLPPRRLIAVAAGWVVLAPLVSHAIRSWLAAGPGEQLSFADLSDPLGLAERLLVTGYYPVLTWTAYVLVGVAVGRLPLRRRQTAVALATGGAGLALLAVGASTLLVGAAGWSRLVTAGPDEQVWPGLGPLQLQVRGLYGTTPTTTWWWETVATPHSGTPFDLAQTIGSALAVLGACLLLVQWVEKQRTPRTGGPYPLARVGAGAVAALAATGSMTLTLYSLHVVLTTTTLGPADREQLLLAHVLLAVVAASQWRAAAPRGPLEQLVRWATVTARRLATARA